MTEQKRSLDGIMELVKCSMKECKKEMEEYTEIQMNGYKRSGILFDKYSNGSITKDKYQKELNKIINEVNKKKEAIDNIKCNIDKCNDHFRTNLIYLINSRLKSAKNKKTRLMLNNYLKLFQEKEIKPQDVKKYYMEIKQIIL